MKKLICVLIILVGAFIFIWGYKLRQPINDTKIDTNPSSSSQIAQNENLPTQQPSSPPTTETTPTPTQPPADSSSTAPSPTQTPSSSSVSEKQPEQEIIEEEIQDGEYTVKQQIVITRTYDENGEILSTKRSEPVEIDRWKTE